MNKKNDKQSDEAKKKARQILDKLKEDKRKNDKYFEFYDDVKDRTRGHEDW
jgi:hypothetical protein